MRFRIFLVGLFLLYFITVSAQNEAYTKANNAYNSSDYSTALELYNSILDEGLESADLYLNLGNTYLKQSNIGKAIWSFERGLKLDADHRQLEQNLLYANKRIKTQLTPIPDFFLSRYWNKLISFFGSTTWAIIQIILLIMMTLSLGFWLLSGALRKKKIAFYSLVGLGIFFVLSMIAGASKTNQLKSQTHAIVISSSTELYSGASDQSELLFDLSEGNKVKIIDEIGEFYKVELIDKEVGWILKNDLEEI